MDTNAPLPPSGRDFDVYRLVRVEDCSTRDAAREFRISQTRVCQILEKVEAFLYATTPDCGPEKRAVRLEIALAIAAERVNRLYKRATELFESEEETYQVTRETTVGDRPPVVIVTTRQTKYETRFSNAALKYSAARAKMPALYLDTLLGPADEDLEDGDLEEEQTPAKEACSTRPEGSVVTAAAGLPPAIVTALQDEPCVLPSLGAMQPNSVHAAPVQSEAPASPRPSSACDRAARQSFLMPAS